MPASADSVVLRRSTLVPDASIIGLAGLAHAVVPSAAWIEAHYSNGAYPVIDRVVRTLTGPVPFCVGDLAFAIAVFLLVRFWYRCVRRARGRIRSASVLAAVRTLAVACGIYLWFLGSWAYGYSRIPLADKIPVHNERTGEDTVNRFGDRVTDELTRAAPAAHRERMSDDEMQRRLTPSFEAAIARLGDAATFSPPRVKPTLFQPLFAASATTGFTDPWTHEVNVDASLFFFERPAIYAHEWSHISGFTDEAEANFIGVLACLNAKDPILRYSGWLLVWENLPGNVRLTHRMGRVAYDDIVSIRARYAKNVNKQVEHASRVAYDRYLKSNHVKAGYASYGLFIRWMTGADFDRNGLPIVRTVVERGTGGDGG